MGQPRKKSRFKARKASDEQKATSPNSLQPQKDQRRSY